MYHYPPGEIEKAVDDSALKLYEEWEQTVQDIWNVMGISKVNFYNCAQGSGE